MFCAQCGKQGTPGQQFCAGCGSRAGMQQPMNQPSMMGQPIQQPVYNQQFNMGTGGATNGMATAGLICAILNIFFGWMVFGLLWIMGLIFSIIGLANAKRNNGAGRGAAIAGLIISVLALIPIILFIALIVWMIATYPYLY